MSSLSPIIGPTTFDFLESSKKFKLTNDLEGNYCIVILDQRLIQRDSTPGISYTINSEPMFLVSAAIDQIRDALLGLKKVSSPEGNFFSKVDQELRNRCLNSMQKIYSLLNLEKNSRSMTERTKNFIGKLFVIAGVAADRKHIHLLITALNELRKQHFPEILSLDTKDSIHPQTVPTDKVTEQTQDPKTASSGVNQAEQPLQEAPTTFIKELEDDDTNPFFSKKDSALRDFAT